MKLLPATSFFFFVLLFFLNSCESNKTPKNKKITFLVNLKDKASQKLKSDEYDSAIFYSKKLLKTSLAQNEAEFILKAYDNLSKCHGFVGDYDSAIFYTHKMLKFALKNKNTKSIKIVYDKLSRYLNSDKKYDSAIFYSEKLYEIALHADDTVTMSRAHYKKGLYYIKMDSLKLAYNNFTISKNLYLKIGDTIKAGKKLLELANLQKKQGNFSASQYLALEGLDYLKFSNDAKSLSGLYHILSVVLKENGEYEEALVKNDSSLIIGQSPNYKKQASRKDIVTYKNTRANIFKEQQKYDEAINIYVSLLDEEKNRKSKDSVEIARIEVNLGHTIYLKEDYNQKSDSLLKKALNTFTHNNETSGLITANLKIAEIYSKKDQRKSLQYINKSIENSQQLGNLSSIYEGMALKFKTQDVLSISDKKLFFNIKSKIDLKKRQLNLLYVNGKFNYDRIYKEKVKAERDQLIAEQKVTKKNNLVITLILVLIILIVLIFFIYQKIKRRHKIEKVKTVHNTEARISTKVHDELANDVYKLMTQLETSDPEREIILDKLDAIYNNARDISKQIQSIDIGAGFPEELFNLFRSYQSDEVNVLLKRYETEIWNGISSHVKTTIYRVLQELLTNMKKHSNAALVVVSIEKRNKELFIQYIDNGKGFTEEISKNGLQNAENRIHAIEGTLTFDAELHKGCKFSINVPV